MCNSRNCSFFHSAKSERHTIDSSNYVCNKCPLVNSFFREAIQSLGCICAIIKSALIMMEAERNTLDGAGRSYQRNSRPSVRRQRLPTRQILISIFTENFPSSTISERLLISQSYVETIFALYTNYDHFFSTVSPSPNKKSTSTVPKSAQLTKLKYFLDFQAQTSFVSFISCFSLRFLFPKRLWKAFLPLFFLIKLHFWASYMIYFLGCCHSKFKCDQDSPIWLLTLRL